MRKCSSCQGNFLPGWARLHIFYATAPRRLNPCPGPFRAPWAKSQTYAAPRSSLPFKFLRGISLRGDAVINLKNDRRIRLAVVFKS
jgi:hypothetical protein